MPLHKINGQWIHYEDTGGNLWPVVLAHGLLMDCEMFSPQIEVRNPDCRVITWDARCHGQTETSIDPFTYWDLADDLRGLLDHLGIERAVIGGADQGGFVALRFALKYPERVTALILLGTQAGAEDHEKIATYDAMLEMWEADGLNDQLAETIGAITFGNKWPGREAWIAKWRQWPRSLLRPAFKALVGREDIHDRLGEIKVPAVVIHGAADAAIDIGMAQRLCSDLANAQPLITIEGGGHACNLTHPTLVNAALQQYLVGRTVKRPQGTERRGDGRRSVVRRRFGERRNPVRETTGRRVVFPFDRRMADRRGSERRESLLAGCCRRCYGRWTILGQMREFDAHVLKQVATEVRNIKAEYHGVASDESIDLVARQSLNSLANSKVPQFVPLFVGRFTRERLRELTGFRPRVELSLLANDRHELVSGLGQRI